MISESITAAIHAIEHPKATKPGDPPPSAVTLLPEEKLQAALCHVGERLRMAKDNPADVQILGDQLVEHASAISADILGPPAATRSTVVRPAPAPTAIFPSERS